MNLGTASPQINVGTISNFSSLGTELPTSNVFYSITEDKKAGATLSISTVLPEDKPIINSKKRRYMAKLPRILIQLAIVVLVWKIVINADAIALFVTHLFLK